MKKEFRFRPAWTRSLYGDRSGASGNWQRSTEQRSSAGSFEFCVEQDKIYDLRIPHRTPQNDWWYEGRVIKALRAAIRTESGDLHRSEFIKLEEGKSRLISFEE